MPPSTRYSNPKKLLYLKGTKVPWLWVDTDKITETKKDA